MPFPHLERIAAAQAEAITSVTRHFFIGRTSSFSEAFRRVQNLDKLLSNIVRQAVVPAMIGPAANGAYQAGIAPLTL
jgi:hypothetical protein